MINNELAGSSNTKVLLLWLTAAAIAPYESERVYYAVMSCISDNAIGRNLSEMQ